MIALADVVRSSRESRCARERADQSQQISAWRRCRTIARIAPRYTVAHNIHKLLKYSRTA